MLAPAALLGLAVLAVAKIADRYLSLAAEAWAFIMLGLGVGAAWLVNFNLFAARSRSATASSTEGISPAGSWCWPSRSAGRSYTRLASWSRSPPRPLACELASRCASRRIAAESRKAAPRLRVRRRLRQARAHDAVNDCAGQVEDGSGAEGKGGYPVR